MKKLWSLMLSLALALSVVSLSSGAVSATPTEGVQTLAGKVWATGVNYAWNNFTDDFSDSNWTSRYTSMQSDMDAMAAKGVKVIRWWVFSTGQYAPYWTGTGQGSTVTGLPTNWVNHMTAVTNYAYSKGMLIYWCLTTHNFAADYVSTNHWDIFNNTTVRNSFLNNAVKPIIDGLKNNPGVYAWDVINEPENIINSSEGGNGGYSGKPSFSVNDMRGFITDTTNFIKNDGAQQPVSFGSANMKWLGGQYNFWENLPVDFYDFHWYDWATPYFDPRVTPASSLKVNSKPVIVGEIEPNPGSTSIAQNPQQVMEAILAKGYDGYLPWAWNDSAYNAQNYLSPYLGNFQANHTSDLYFGPAASGGGGGGGTETTLYDFEGTTQGWTALNVTGGPYHSGDAAVTGTEGLKADVNLSSTSKYYELHLTAAQNFTGKTTLRARVKHAAWGNPGTGIQAKLYVKTGSSYTWNEGATVTINSTSATTLSITLTGISNINDVKEFGVSFIAPSSASGGTSIYVDNVTIQ